jgi:hypothetical protein
MGWPPVVVVFGSLLVAVTAAVAVGWGWRQVRTLRQGGAPDLPDEERRRQRFQAWRRLVGCVLMLLLAAMVAGYLIFLDGPADRLAKERDAAPPGTVFPRDEAERGFMRFYGWYLVSVMLVLLALMVLTGYDLWALRRQARREQRQLQADRRAMIARQIDRMRQERDGG